MMCAQEINVILSNKIFGVNAYIPPDMTGGNAKTNPAIMKKLMISICTALFLPQLAYADDAVAERKKVEFFEKLYKTKIVGVKLLEGYPDPDQFYSAIAKQVGIPEIALDAVEKKFGWKQNEKYFLYAMVKGGWGADNWGVMVTRFPTGLKTAQSKEETMKLLKGMEMRMVVIGYNGKVTFPKEKKEEPDLLEKERPGTSHVHRTALQRQQAKSLNGRDNK